MLMASFIVANQNYLGPKIGERKKITPLITRLGEATIIFGVDEMFKLP